MKTASNDVHSKWMKNSYIPRNTWMRYPKQIRIRVQIKVNGIVAIDKSVMTTDCKRTLDEIYSRYHLPADRYGVCVSSL